MILYYCTSPITDVLAVRDAFFGRGRSPIHLDQVGCDGTESRLEDCSHDGVGNHDCNHFEDASVICGGMQLYRRK